MPKNIILAVVLVFGLIFALFAGAGYANYILQSTPEAQEKTRQENCRGYKKVLTENRHFYIEAFIKETEVKYQEKGC